METLYITAAKEAQAEIIIERSRFISAAAHVTGREDAERFIASIRKKYRDATHNVPAYIVGEKSEIKAASDDGEPAGTAGGQILRMIEARGLTFTAVVVTRYFGGKKLGTGGLSRAYAEAAAKALDSAGAARAVMKDRIGVSCGYPEYGKVTRSGALAAAAVRNEKFGASVTFELVCDSADSDAVLSAVRDATAGSAKTERLGSFIDLVPA
jgi:uncharacterized YigZ family protein